MGLQRGLCHLSCESLCLVHANLLPFDIWTSGRSTRWISYSCGWYSSFGKYLGTFPYSGIWMILWCEGSLYLESFGVPLLPEVSMFASGSGMDSLALRMALASLLECLCFIIVLLTFKAMHCWTLIVALNLTFGPNSLWNFPLGVWACGSSVARLLNLDSRFKVIIGHVWQLLWNDGIFSTHSYKTTGYLQRSTDSVKQHSAN